MKLRTALTLLGYVAIAVPACHADAPSSQSPSASAGSANSAGSTNTSAGANSAGSSSGAGAGGVGGAIGASGGSGGLPPLQECTTKPSIDRITAWTATSGECTCTPIGDILTKEGQTGWPRWSSRVLIGMSCQC